MPTYDGITITIRVEGRDLPEFMVERDPADTTRKKVSCWIPSQLGKEFVITVDNKRKHGIWSARVKADGIRVRSSMISPLSKRDIGLYQQSPTVSRALTFAKIELVDDDSLLGSSHAHQVGEIEVKCRNVHKEDWQPSTRGIRAFSENKRLHERTKKGIAEHISLGREIVHTPKATYRIRYTGHIVTFVFRYRPLDFLRAQGIVPSPSLSPRPQSSVNVPTQDKRIRNRHKVKTEVSKETALEARDQVEGDTDQEIKALQARVQELKAWKRKQKQISGSVQKKVKTEPQFDPGKVIDLT